jgi:hypothetical protein
MKKRKNNHYHRPALTPEMISRLETLFDAVTPENLRDYLLEIYHCYIIREHESLPSDFEKMSISMQILLDFLKFAKEEMQDQSLKG